MIDKFYILELFGAFFALVSIFSIVTLSKRKRWRSTECQITHSTVEVNVKHYNNMLSKQKIMNAYSTKSYTTNLRYEYEVAGSRYYASNLFSSPLAFTTVSDILPYTDGSKHIVWYNPKNPLKTYLKKSSMVPSAILLVLSVVLIAHTGVRFLVDTIL